MASSLLIGADYHEMFDPKKYLSMSCSAPRGSDEERYFRDVHLKELHKIFSSGVIESGSRLLDLGTGPTIYQLISASRYCTEIICAEYAEANRAEVKKWIEGDPGAYDWTDFFKYVAELEGDSSSWEARQSHLRDTIKEVIPCDVTKSDPLAPRQYKQFDVITAIKCLETACSTRDSFSAAVRSVTRLLRPGGMLVLVSLTAESFYSVGDHTFFTLSVDGSFIAEVLEDAGYVDIHVKRFPAPRMDNGGHWDGSVTDFHGFTVSHARKPE